jgi:hypothetical protein
VTGAPAEVVESSAMLYSWVCVVEKTKTNPDGNAKKRRIRRNAKSHMAKSGGKTPGGVF